MTFRLIRLFTGADGQSHFDLEQIPWQRQDALSAVSAMTAVEDISFEESAAGSRLDWHNAPRRQYVITLGGRLQFETRGGATQIIGPGDILLAEDTEGGGHRWHLLDDQPWRRVYVTLASAGATIVNST
jgi:hypothetical protein